jgi:PKD repeat protein
MKMNIKNITAFIFLLALSACQKNEMANQFLTAGGVAPVYNYTPDNSNALLIKFSNPVLAAGTTYQWSFGDGKYATGQNPAHTYDSGGTYLSKLTVTNNAGIFTTEKSVLVSAANFTLATNDATDALKITVVNKSINCGDFKWQWGDGTEILTENPGSHTYAAPGVYRVKLFAKLAANSTINTAKEIKVLVINKNDLAGTVSKKWKYHPTEGISFFGSFSNQLSCELNTEFIFFANNNYQCDNKGEEIVFPNCTVKPARPVTTWSLTRVNLIAFKLNIGAAGVSFFGDPVTGPNYTLVNLTDTLLEIDKVNFGFTDEVKYKMLKFP